MPDTAITITIDNVGTSIAQNGTLTSIQMTKPPLTPRIYMKLVDTVTGEEIFCCEMSSSFFPTGVVFPMYNHPFQDLTLVSISPESEYVINIGPQKHGHKPGR